MRKFIHGAAGIGLGLAASSSFSSGRGSIAETGAKTRLPGSATRGALSVEEAIQGRRSERSFWGIALTQAQLSQLVWSAQGITDPARIR